MRRALLAGLVLLWAGTARAHKPSDSYLTLRTDGARLAAQWDIALRDLEQAIGLDGNGDGAITWGEVRARQDAITAYALAHLHADGDGTACRAGSVEALRIDSHTDGAYAVLRFAFECAAAPQALALRYSLFFDFDPQHRGLLRIVGHGETRALLFSADQPLQRIDLGSAGSWQSVRAFWRNGVWHIWAGSEHVLFLLALLLPAVLRREHGVWRPARRRDAVVGTLKIVTAFTIAYSITLSLAAIGVVHVPARLVESGIAASVVLAALNNAYPLFPDGRWLLGFACGLLHGFGFAGVLTDPALPIGSLMTALLGFNLGLETGQLVLVGAVLPLTYFARRSWMYQRVTMVLGSSLIAVLATVWLLERALDVHLL